MPEPTQSNPLNFDAIFAAMSRAGDGEVVFRGFKPSEAELIANARVGDYRVSFVNRTGADDLVLYSARAEVVGREGARRFRGTEAKELFDMAWARGGEAFKKWRAEKSKEFYRDAVRIASQANIILVGKPRKGEWLHTDGKKEGAFVYKDDKFDIAIYHVKPQGIFDADQAEIVLEEYKGAIKVISEGVEIYLPLKDDAGRLLFQRLKERSDKRKARKLRSKPDDNAAAN